MAEFGENNKSAVGPPVAGWKAASGGGGMSPETPVSNGNCTVKRLQKQPSCESPTWESAGSDSASKAIPRRSSLIKDGSRAGRDRKKTRYYLLDAGLQALCWEPSKKESDKARISLASIREVRTGRNTETFRTSGVYEQISEDCAFSIIYGEMYESLDLVANSAEVANIWVTGLRYLMQYGKHALDMLASSQDSLRLGWLEQLFSSAADSDDLEEDVEGLRLQLAVKLIRSVNPGVGGGKVELRFKELQRVRTSMSGLTLENESGAKDPGDNKRPIGRNERVTKQDFIKVFHDFCTRPEIYFLLVQFSSNKEFLDTKDLMRFLEAEQGMAQVSEETSLKLILSHEPSEEGRQQGYLSLDGFTSYLTSAECHLFDKEHDGVCQDMTQPLSHYYISSSHNTYLIEDQFRGPSDISGYIRALKMGCRCVEVDVWDGPDGEPVVCTGHSLSPPLLLHCVLDAIGRFAFVASHYPLIVCIENHCSVQQQQVMWQHLVKILGEKLYVDPPYEGKSYLPSPHALRNRNSTKG
ncbi:Inactive phospholipase C-like protein 2 [Dissostichus eleginoides]|uniref:Phosphoinositide phospholipase C n=1 Tax=Dissostichus eleginoides TaxID=100907 RepID=A0AAD9BCF5_DISEL|nr:Inactive phospholipase C-like protein 2 [Dissostichus eleginoides]